MEAWRSEGICLQLHIDYVGGDGSEICFHHALRFLPMTFLGMAIGDDAKTVGFSGI